jgi:restriction system protein
MGQVMQAQLLRTFAQFGQFVLPAAFGLGGFVSGIKKISRARLARTVTGSLPVAGVDPTVDSPRVAADIDWQDFEKLVGEAFRLLGYKVTETGPSAGDGGVDLVLSRGGQRHLVQCKQWGARRVGVKPVRELAGVIAREGATGGFVVTNGEFTEEAIRFSKGSTVTVLDGAVLQAMLKSARGKPLTSKASLSECFQEPSPVAATEAPCCPRCGEFMVRRVAKRGKSMGEDFWGCAAFPRCRGSRAADWKG